MHGKEIKKMVQNRLLEENEDLFFVLIHGLNGIIMLSQLYSLLGGRTKSNQKLIQSMEETDLIKATFIGKNKVILARHKIYDYLGLNGKVTSLSGISLKQSTLFAEIYLSKLYDIPKMKKEIQVGNQAFHSPDSSLNLLIRIHNFLQKQNKSSDLSILKNHIEILEDKREFFLSRRRWEKSTMKEYINKTEDLLTLKAKGIYVADVRWKNNKISFDISILPTNTKIKKYIDTISIGFQFFSEILYPNEIDIQITVYSHSKPDIGRYNAIYRMLVKRSEFKGVSDISSIVSFKDFSSQYRLFGNINVQNLV